MPIVSAISAIVCDLENKLHTSTGVKVLTLNN